MAKLYFYYSAMNAGKSAVLLQSNHNYREKGLNTLLYTPRLDNRYGVGKITSRIGLQSAAKMFDREFDLFVDIQNEMQQKDIHCVLIDESQFLTKIQVLELTLVVDHLNIPVLCYGLRSDFRGEPFEGSMYLLTWADELSEIKTICHSGSKATMNARLDDQGNRVWDGSQVEIGHNYVSMSRKEFQLHRSGTQAYEISVPTKNPTISEKK
jgi:thymidine kinase